MKNLAPRDEATDLPINSIPGYNALLAGELSADDTPEQAISKLRRMISEAGGGASKTFTQMVNDPDAIFDHFDKGYLNGVTWVLSTQNNGTISGATVAGRVGVVYLSGSAANAAGRATMYRNTNGYLSILGQGTTSVKFLATHSVLSDVTNTYWTQLGITSNVFSADPANGLVFEYLQATSGNFWRIKCRKANAQTLFVTSVPVVANAFDLLEIDVNADATSAVFKINGVTVHTEATNIPSGTSQTVYGAMTIQKTAGTTIDVRLLADAYYEKPSLTTPLL